MLLSAHAPPEKLSSKVMTCLLFLGALAVVAGVFGLQTIKHRAPPRPKVAWKWPASGEILLSPIPPGVPLDRTIDDLMMQLKAADDESIHPVLYGLMLHGHKAVPALPLLRSRVRSQDELLRWQIAGLCVVVKDNGCSDLLSTLMHDGHPAVKLEALRAVAHLPGPLTADQLFELRSSLDQAEDLGNPRLALASAGSLAKHGTPADVDHAVSVLAELLEYQPDKSAGAPEEGRENAVPLVRNTAAQTLGLLGARAESALPALIKALKEADQGIDSARLPLAVSIGKIPGKNSLVIPALIEILPGESSPARQAVWQALAARVRQSPEIARDSLEKVQLPEELRKQIEQLKE